MKPDWQAVTREHVIKAIDRFLKENPVYPEAKSTFLLYDGKKLPAKHIRGMAYKEANFIDISKQDFSGGMETVRFFRNLGFEVDYTGKSKNESNKIVVNSKPKHKNTLFADLKKKFNLSKAYNDIADKDKADNDKIKIPTKGVIEQKNALQRILNKLCDGDIVCESTFEWLKTPETCDGIYKDIYEALNLYRGDTNFAKKNVRLRCDFVCESKKLIIEYDERQHFSKAREITLDCYKGLPVCYDVNLWKRACSDIEAKDNNPKNRDEIRAYYDSVRDIGAAKNGYRLVRIMHGQIDFEKEGAKEQLIKLLEGDESEKSELKVGLYLQTTDKHNSKDFKKAMSVVKNSDIDILVFPEISYVPFRDLLWESDIDNIDDLNKIYDECLRLSNQIDRSIVIGGIDSYGTIFSVYANANSNCDETKTALYIKCTATEYSAFDFENYEEVCMKQFVPFVLKGYRIGLTICYDCNHSLFSRMYGIQGVDIILNCTGGNVVYDKWYKYTKARAIENNCFTFTTMGGDLEKFPVNSYVYGFSPSGKELTPKLINAIGADTNVPGGIYVYSVRKDDGIGQEDTSIDQKHSVNKYREFILDPDELDNILNSSLKIENNLYVYQKKDANIVFIITKDDEIFSPEKFMPLLYSDKLKNFNDKRYIIVNKYENLDKQLYENKLSVVLKVRAMENYCAVLLISDLINMCYQTGQNKNAQVLKLEKNSYALHLARMKGPEVIWKNKDYTKAHWRDKYYWLAKQCDCYIKYGKWLKTD